MILTDAKELLPNRGSRLMVTWMLGNICTFKCSYCNERYNGGTIPFHAPEKVLAVMNQLPECDVMFLGGEPTAWSSFEYVLENAPAHVNVQILSNGARPLPFWERVAPRLQRVVLTCHPEYMSGVKVARFEEVAVLLGEKLVRVNVPMKPDDWEFCLWVFNTLRTAGVKVVPKVLLKNFGHTANEVLDDYTAEQLRWIDSNQEAAVHTLKIVYTDGRIKSTNPGEMLAVPGGTDFSGWECHTPASFIGVDADGSIYDSMCAQRRKIGHIDTGLAGWKPSTVTCAQQFCWCYSDLQTRKINHGT